MNSPSSTLSVTVAHVVSYLTRPLIMSYPAVTIIKLQLVLEANLTSVYAASWVPQQPLRGSGRRCMTLSPTCLPPRAIYAACLASGVQWFDWIACLGGREFDLLVDPGYIALRFGKKGAAKTIPVWADERSQEIADAAKAEALQLELRIQAQLKEQSDARAFAQRKTLVEQLSEEDDDELFAMIADHVSAPTWSTPTVSFFPDRPSSALSDISDDSSLSSGGCSFSSAESMDSLSSSALISRRERARQARVYIDHSKTDVTDYDSGKVGVLTGGVMLGGGPKKAVAPVVQARPAFVAPVQARPSFIARPSPVRATRPSNGGSWRSIRA